MSAYANDPRVWPFSPTAYRVLDNHGLTWSVALIGASWRANPEQSEDPHGSFTRVDDAIAWIIGDPYNPSDLEIWL